MKKIFFLFLTTAALQNASAQLNTNLVVIATPPSALTEWNNKKEVLTFLVQPGPGLQFTYKIRTEIRLGDGTVVGRTDLARSATYAAASTNAVYYAGDVIPLENMIFNGKYKSALEKTGKLPSDNYQICVRLVRPTDFTPVSEEKCRSFYLAALQLPILLKPYNEEVLDATVANNIIMFRWSPVVPRQTTPVTYRIAVFEVLENQNPVQAMRSNMPILDKEVRGATQYIWQTQGITGAYLNRMVTDSTKKKKQYVGHVSLIKRTIKPGDTDSLNNDDPVAAFAWIIQALDTNGKPLGDGNINGDGVSEPVVFFVRGKVKTNPLQ